MTVAVVGAGNMGGALVERLCEAQWPVTVCDTDPMRQQQALAAGASLADSPLSAVAQLGPRDALVIVVVDADQCREVLWGEQGAAIGLRPGQAVVLCPTIAPDDTVGIAERLATQGIDCIDAPMLPAPTTATVMTA
jgi:L-threonate 2-dehydrogenase